MGTSNFVSSSGYLLLWDDFYFGYLVAKFSGFQQSAAFEKVMTKANSETRVSLSTLDERPCAIVNLHRCGLQSSSRAQVAVAS
jgi:hypothetical protein